MVDAHARKSADAQQNRNDKEHLSLSDKIDRLPWRLHAPVYFRIPDSKSIDRENDQSGHHKRREHRHYYAQRKRLRKSSDRSASAEPEHRRRDQRCDITVQNR